MNLSNNAERPNPGRGSASKSAPNNANNAGIHSSCTSGTRHPLGQTVLPLRHPVAYASLYAPAGRRRCWWFAYVCCHCGFGHFGRVRDENTVEGVRRSGCGRLVWIIVARTYRGAQSEVAA
ncbi:hypothetical protein [Planomonospora sp. ID82291]|uniref:hypothetical protein n=1 Tax=Planomonospora sp. ID82291 TaxID=2738136 RepID=UPI0018C3C573|nr:hypothetical protein [Planomonospora sp. ID82291]MBG0818202.1 hypothetical protein [Planomonospora sp. ID82291]